MLELGLITHTKGTDGSIAFGRGRRSFSIQGQLVNNSAAVMETGNSAMNYGFCMQRKAKFCLFVSNCLSQWPTPTLVARVNISSVAKVDLVHKAEEGREYAAGKRILR